ncbi:LOW QUALITY PROTEIN: interferon alpha-3-like [Zalophus californianus]|uniref:LOW QUALITY PROTEIN: interferon alpha-3-like n=1 Tax=Zalophus californianus TaxID=9704 RepID=A0A6J2ESN2_ZALCA|nr:LOW QUALITY PROTEIN: interferon alpha-3-like [Zalophus californianus]
MVREPRATVPRLAHPSQVTASAGSAMALPVSFLVALVVLSSSSLCSLGCDLPQNHDLFAWRALTLLGQMKRMSASSCDKYTSDFAFPQEVLDGKQWQKAQALSVIHGMDEKIFHLFCTGASSPAWNTSLLEEFCSGIYQQLTDLEACLMQEVGLGETPLRKVDSILRNYFQRISLYLQEKQYSPCAWEIVRAEITSSLFASTILQERLRSKQ